MVFLYKKLQLIILIKIEFFFFRPRNFKELSKKDRAEYYMPLNMLVYFAHL